MHKPTVDCLKNVKFQPAIKERKEERKKERKKKKKEKKERKNEKEKMMQSSFEALHHKRKISINPRNARPPSLRKGGWENTKKNYQFHFRISDFVIWLGGRAL